MYAVGSAHTMLTLHIVSGVSLDWAVPEPAHKAMLMGHSMHHVPAPWAKCSVHSQSSPAHHRNSIGHHVQHVSGPFRG